MKTDNPEVLEAYQIARSHAEKNGDETLRQSAQRKINVYFFGHTIKERRSRMNKTDDPFRKWD